LQSYFSWRCARDNPAAGNLNLLLVRVLSASTAIGYSIDIDPIRTAMKPSESVRAFEAFAVNKGLDLNASTARAGIETMFEFKAASVCASCSEDMLLYQWGSYDWGSGKYFEINITRQFVEAELEDDDAISQLSLTYRFRTSLEFDRLGASNYWEDGPLELRQAIATSEAFVMLADAKPECIELIHSYV
jgi:hypothetical protein